MSKLEEMKELLIVIDMLKGFVDEGALADPYIQHIIPEQERLIQKFLKQEQAVMFVKDAHQIGDEEFENYPVHCLQGSIEGEVVEALKPYEKRGIVIEKNTTCAFTAPHFQETIDRMTNLKRIVGVGCEADICIPDGLIPLRQYLQATGREDIDIVVPMNAIETFDSPVHPRKEWYEKGCQQLQEAGIVLVKKYE